MSAYVDAYAAGRNLVWVHSFSCKVSIRAYGASVAFCVAGIERHENSFRGCARWRVRDAKVIRVAEVIVAA